MFFPIPAKTQGISSTVSAEGSALLTAFTFFVDAQFPLLFRGKQTARFCLCAISQLSCLINEPLQWSLWAQGLFSRSPSWLHPSWSQSQTTGKLLCFGAACGNRSRSCNHLPLLGCSACKPNLSRTGFLGKYYVFCRCSAVFILTSAFLLPVSKAVGYCSSQLFPVICSSVFHISTFILVS